MIDLALVADRLTRTREMLQVSREIVAVDTGVGVDRLGHIESGHVRPTGDEILILANYYSRDFRDFLDPSRLAPYERTDILFRRHGSEFTVDDRRSVQEFLFLCENEADLQKHLGVEAKHFSFRVDARAMHKAHGASAALELRRFLGYGPRQIRLDVYDDFRALGIHVFRRRLSNPDISGLYIDSPRAGHCVLVNFDDDIYRQRFSVCHEVAHSIFDSNASASISFKRGSSKYNRSDLVEIRANVFASHYLLPPEVLPRGQAWTDEAIRRWAQTLKVSTEALSYALSDAKIVDDQTAKRIRSIRVPSAEKVDPEAPNGLTERQTARRKDLLEKGLSDHYVGLCFEAHHRGLISIGRLGELLLTSSRDLGDISVVVIP